MMPFLKNNNEKLTLIIVLILAIIIFFTSLAGATGDKTPSPDKSKEEIKAGIMAFNQVIKEMEASLNTEEDKVYKIQQKARCYDAGFNPIYQATQQEIEEEADRKVFKLLGKSTLFMEQG